jgi:hypothetical protein
MSESKHVVCVMHGSTPVTFACRHIALGVACGFHFDDSNPSDRWPDAWCDGCEEQRDAAGAWTDELAMAVLEVVCTHCWESARARNERAPSLARGRNARFDDDERERFFGAASDFMKRTQDAAKARWKLGGFPRWDFNDETRTITFSDQGPRLVADVRMVGSYATTSQTFQWSWVLYGKNDPLVDGVAELSGFGEVRGIERLATNWWECDIGEAWQMTAVAAYLLGCEAVYRAPFDDLYWFMLLGGFREAT